MPRSTATSNFISRRAMPGRSSASPASGIDPLPHPSGSRRSPSR
jgi:hypothetical protein